MPIKKYIRPMSEWNKPRCPYCGSPRISVEVKGESFWCHACGEDWPRQEEEKEENHEDQT